MSEILGVLLKGVKGAVEAVQRADSRVADWSLAKAEGNRQKELGRFMAKTEKELRGSEDFNLLKKYLETRAQYRKLLPFLHESKPGEPSRWIKEGGNKVETQYHRLAEEIRLQHPNLLPKMGKVDSFLPF